MSDINDLIGLTIDKNPVDFAEAFNAIITKRVEEALDARRIKIAASLYQEDTEVELGNLDEDFDEEDLDEEDLDEDLDLDDLDFSDLEDEFEGIDDDYENA